MLSTPPAFNLSQNQTLQFKSVQDFCFRRNRNLKEFLPTRYSLVNEPLGLSARRLSVGAKETYAPFRPCCQQLFFNPPKSVLTKLLQAVCSFSRTREAYAPFSQPCQLLFALSTNFLRRVQAQSVAVSRKEKIEKQAQTVKPYLNFSQQFQSVSARDEFPYYVKESEPFRQGVYFDGIRPE